MPNRQWDGAGQVPLSALYFKDDQLQTPSLRICCHFDSRFGVYCAENVYDLDHHRRPNCNDSLRCTVLLKYEAGEVEPVPRVPALDS